MIFPKEILNHTAENHFIHFNSRSVIIYLSIIASIIVALSLLPIIKIDITVQSRGIIRSNFESQTIYSPITAQVNKISIKENQMVNKGDTLIWLKDDIIVDKQKHIQIKKADNQEYIADLNNMHRYESDRLKSNLYKSEYSEYFQKIKEYDFLIRQTKKEYNRSKLLFNKEVIASNEYEQKEFAFQKNKEEKRLYFKQIRSKWQQMIYKYTLEVRELDAEFVRLTEESNNYFIVAPASGNISNYSGIKEGGFLLPGQPIAILTPNDSLVIESYVSPNDIGYIREGMKASFQIDAFNYNQWGLSEGSVIDISNEIFQTDNGSFFKVECNMKKKFLQLKNGYKGVLKKGLTLTARFKITRRSLSQLLYDKADNWLNPQIINTK